MDDQFYTLAKAAPIESAKDLTIARALDLLSAVQGHKDYSLVQLLRRTDPHTEYIVVDVVTDSVPPQNSSGIKYRERLAFCVPADPKVLIDVRSLRKDFPILPHQNHVISGDARSLCLYFEPALSVSRNWTPQNFLQRIQWWLEKTAKEELHPADQPVEQLFFADKYELVLP